MLIEEIKEYLPHRYPFLLVDRIEELNIGSDITGYKNITINEEFFNGHFVNEPVMPGALIIEALAQVAGVLGCATMGTKPGLDGSIHYLVKVDNARFTRKVVPGDKLYLEAKLKKRRNRFWYFSCCARVENEVCCTVDIMTVEKQ